MQTYEYEYTDTFGGDANYCWVKRGKVHVPDLTAYGYDGSQGYAKANKRQSRHIMRLVKAKLGLSGLRGKRDDHGDMIVWKPYRSATVLFVTYCDD